jgi:hypothetical protein
MLFGNVQRRDAARVRHQMLDLPRAPDGIQPEFAVMPSDSTQAPQRIVQAVAVQHRDNG